VRYDSVSEIPSVNGFEVIDVTSPAVDPAKLADALDAYKAGKPVNECAAIAGVHRHTIQNHARRAGIQLRYQPPDPDLLDAAVLAYENGSTVSACAEMCGIGHETFRQRLIERGIRLRGRSGAAAARRLPTPPGFIDDYISGMSVKALAGKYGFDRNAAYRMLAEAGIDGRDRSSAMRLRWQRATEAERRAMLDAPHAATRGRTVTDEVLTAAAATKAARVFSSQETDLGAMLAELGLDIAYGVPCGPYNIDIVIAGTVAVEVQGGNWHETGDHRALFPKRSRHILDAGYSLAIVWTNKVRYPLGVKCAQHLATLAQIAGSHPAIGRQHWVIRGDGYFLAVREDDGNEVPFVSASGRREG
jgi:transposase-like protein